jgi:hypothetical protein
MARKNPRYPATKIKKAAITWRTLFRLAKELIANPPARSVFPVIWHSSRHGVVTRGNPHYAVSRAFEIIERVLYIQQQPLPNPALGMPRNSNNPAERCFFYRQFFPCFSNTGFFRSKQRNRAIDQIRDESSQVLEPGLNAPLKQPLFPSFLVSYDMQTNVRTFHLSRLTHEWAPSQSTNRVPPGNPIG